jgi:hypothetical protein
MTEYGRIHTDGSRSGGQPVTDILERLRTKYCCTTENCNCEEAATEIETLRHDLERQITIANEHVNEVERLREALRFYAREANYRSTTMYMSGQGGKTAIEIDGGQRARAALEQSK